MSVVKVEYLAPGREVTVDKIATPVFGSGSVLSHFYAEGSGREQYLVYCDDPTDREITVLSHSGVPKPGNVKVEKSKRVYGLYVTSVSATYDSYRHGYYCWLVTVNFGKKEVVDRSTADDNENKELWSFSYSVDDEDFFVSADRTNKQNKNTLGEWYSEPLNCPNGIVRFNYTFKQTNNPTTLSRDYYNKINNAVLWGWAAAKTVKVESITGSCTVREQDKEWTTNIVVAYKANGWDVQKANAGHYYVANNVTYRLLNSDGSVADEPVLLAANGTILPDNTAPVFNTFQIYDMADLSQLYLPDPLTI